MNHILKNNSNEMKTEVETFVIEETAELIYDGEKLDQWNKHVDELGLEGQKTIVKPDKSPIPFMHMKSTVKSVFETLCPMKVTIERFNINPIPVEILDLIALSKREGYFDRMEIWYDDKNLDPACVGFVYNSEEDRRNKYTWSGQYYLLGRWADVKASFSELKERAISRFKEQKISELTQKIKEYQRDLEDIDHTVLRDFGTDTTLPF